MITNFKIFENMNEYSFKIIDIIKYFDEEHDFYDKTHKFLKDNLVHKNITIKGKYNNYSNIIPNDLMYSPRSSPEFWLDISIGINKMDDIIYLNNASEQTKEFLKLLNIYKDSNKYNL